MATTSMSAPEAQPRINPLGRIIGVFTSPKQTFSSIAERPSWLAPLLLCAVLATCVGAMLNAKMNWGEYIRHKAEENPRFAQMSEEQKDQALAVTRSDMKAAANVAEEFVKRKLATQEKDRAPMHLTDGRFLIKE